MTYSLFDDDGGNFSIDANTGMVTTAKVLDRESLGGTRSITVRSTSQDGSFADSLFTIQLNDIDEFDVGTVSDSNSGGNRVADNAALGTLVGITASAQDGDATNNGVSFSLFDDDGGRFAIDANTGVVTVNGAIDREADGPSRTITVRATSQDGSTQDQIFSIAIDDIDEFDVTAPVDANGALNRVDENSAAGTLVGLVAFAEDLDATNQTVIYRLLDDAQGRFTIDTHSGVVSVASGASLNFEAASSHGIVIEAESQDGSKASQSFVIQVVDVQENPIGGNDRYQTDFLDDLQIGASGLLANDSDPDGDALTSVLVVGPDHGSLVLQSNGSFLYTPEIGYTGTVTFVYRATDGGLSSSDITVTIEIVMPIVPPPTGGGARVVVQAAADREVEQETVPRVVLRVLDRPATIRTPPTTVRVRTRRRWLIPTNRSPEQPSAQRRARRKQRAVAARHRRGQCRGRGRHR